MFTGYLELGGVPLINAQATAAYVAHLAPQVPLKDPVAATKLHIANDDDPYRTPVLDDAAWVNRLDPTTHGFLGLYPISIEGLDGSTVAAGVTEYLSDGGSVSAQRDASRSVRVTGLLVGTDMLAAQAGLSWLTAALRDDDCVDCSAGTLRYFVAHPEVCEEAYGEEIGTRSRSFGRLAPGTFRYRLNGDQIDEDSPLRARWDAAWDEGTVVTVGLADVSGTTALYTAAPVTPLRRNYLPNPTWRTDLSGWSIVGATSTATWMRTGGADGGSFVRLAPNATAPYGTAPLGTAPFGGGAGTIQATSLAAPAAGVITGSVAVRAVGTPGLVRVQLLNAAGTVLGATTVTVGTDWTRVSVTATAVSGLITLRILGIASTIDIDQALLERGSTAQPYFDGTTVESSFRAAWEGLPDVSVSSRTWTGNTELRWDTATARPTLALGDFGASAVQLTWGVRRLITLTEQLLPYERNLFDVSAVQGPLVLRTVDLSDTGRGVFMQVEFTLVAGNPAVYSLPETVSTASVASAPYSDPVFALSSVNDLSWLADPAAQVVTRPPSAPIIINPTIESITTWTRYYVSIPASQVADWTESIPTVVLTSFGNPITQVRVRIHPNPFGYTPQQVDPLNYCSEFVLSYLPALTRLQVDGVLERATASRGDRATASADHLLYGADGGPISWPKLSCAIPYVLTIDIPPGGAISSFAVELTLRRKQ